ncbi:hypothetical protein EC973_001641 [Apophysomyces ossiformis]|uniref:Uncharacterized protein n=1 Tax=Apophysomyces ossiformis TaxID=679940 RepID=A0A8H7ETX9_9FUNG|nr:hypothetical protein EC973_001641 [Apophysomyces ossiformis]
MQSKPTQAKEQHPPAQMVGGMRVRGHPPRRSSLRGESTNNNNEEDEGMEHARDMEQNRATQERQAYQMYAHGAARDLHVPKNPGTNVRLKASQGVQERSQNH